MTLLADVTASAAETAAAVSTEGSSSVISIGDISNELVIKLAILVIVVLLTLKVVSVIGKLINSKMSKDVQPKMKGLLNAIKIIFVVIVILTWMSLLGINTSNVLAIVATVLMAIVIALRDYLANMAGGVMILTLKPFVVGDYIICEEGEGTVQTIYLARTDIVTIDKKVICIPNGKMVAIAVTNTSTDPQRRLDIEVDVAYDTDIPHCREVLEKIYQDDPEIIKDKEIFAHVLKMKDSGFTMRVEGYVANARYWDIRWRLLEAVLTELPKNGIEIPYNKMDIYMKQIEAEKARETS